MKNRKTIKKQWYSTLLKASEEMQPVDSLSFAGGELSVEEAYDVQAMLVQNRIKRGERIIGWKGKMKWQLQRKTICPYTS